MTTTTDLPTDAAVRRAALAWADAAERMARAVRDAVEARDGAAFGLIELASATPGAPVRAILADAAARDLVAGIGPAR